MVVKCQLILYGYHTILMLAAEKDVPYE